jgi:hypothetical protein
MEENDVRARGLGRTRKRPIVGSGMIIRHIRDALRLFRTRSLKTIGSPSKQKVYSGIRDVFSEPCTAWLQREDSSLEMANWMKAAYCAAHSLEIGGSRLFERYSPTPFR